MFKKDVLKFRDGFNAQKGRAAPIETVNKQITGELKNEVSDLVCSSALLCRFHYLAFSKKYQGISDLMFPLKPMKPITMSQALKFFGPGQKDRFTTLLEFLGSHAEVFAQSLYLFLSARGRDCEVCEEDRKWFCFATFPAVFNFLLCDSDRKRALDVLSNMVSLHLYLHGSRFSGEHAFLSDLVFGVFLATNPGHFFEHSVLPLVPALSVSVVEREFQYAKTDNVISRNVYWRHIAKFTDGMFQRMKEAIPLLPPSCRELIRMIEGIDFGDFPKRYFLIFDTMFCAYLRHFVDFERPEVCQDVIRFIRSCYPASLVTSQLPKPVEAGLLESARASLESFLNLVVLDDKVSENGLSDGVDIGGRHTLLTPLDLCLSFRCADNFLKACGKGVCKDLEKVMESLSEPKGNDNDKYMLFKRDGGRNPLKTKKCETGEIGNLVGVMDYIHLESLEFKNSSQLISLLDFHVNEFLDPSERVKLSVQSVVVAECRKVLKAVETNNTAIQNLADRLASGLYYVNNERKRHSKQIRQFSLVHIEHKVLPAIVEFYPKDFRFYFNELYSPNEAFEAYTSLIETVGARLESFGLAPENVLHIKKRFFWEYVDQLEKTFNVQESVEIEKSSLLLGQYAQTHRSALQGLKKRRVKKLGDAAQQVQNVKNCHRFSDNADWAIHAIDVVQIFDNDKLAYAFAMSGNGELFCFHRMMKTYVFPSEIVYSLLFTDKEQKLLNRFIDIMNILEKFAEERGFK